LQETFGYYGIKERDYLLNPNAVETFASLTFGIVKFLVLSLISWMLAVIFFLKRNNKELSK
jgi:hypothetical protein